MKDTLTTLARTRRGMLPPQPRAGERHSGQSLGSGRQWSQAGRDSGCRRGHLDRRSVDCRSIGRGSVECAPTCMPRRDQSPPYMTPSQPPEPGQSLACEKKPTSTVPTKPGAPLRRGGGGVIFGAGQGSHQGMCCSAVRVRGALARAQHIAAHCSTAPHDWRLVCSAQGGTSNPYPNLRS